MDLAELRGGTDVAEPTSVHPIETTLQLFADLGVDKDHPASYREKCLARYPDLRVIVETTFDLYDRCYGSRFYERFLECRRYASFNTNVDDEESVRVHSSDCRLRWCPMCASKRESDIEASAYEFFNQQKEVRFATLTLKHSDDPLPEQIRRIKKSWVKLRRSRAWKKYVTGDLYALQIKPVYGGNGWHLHLHILFTGKYLPQRILKDKWLKATGDSYVVDVRTVYNLDKALKDICRYVGRPANLMDVSPEHRLEIMKATERVRLVGVDGICKAISLRPRKVKVDRGKFVNLGRYETVIALAIKGDLKALAVLRAYRDGTKLTREQAEAISCAKADAKGPNELDPEYWDPPPQKDEFSYREEEIFWPKLW